MLFLIRTEFRRPPEIDDVAFEVLRGDEARQARTLQEAGTIRHLWREPNTSITWGIWQAEDETDVRAQLQSLPAHFAMTVEIRKVIDHPNALRAEATPRSSL
jgi:muconolactone D-isomerase